MSAVRSLFVVLFTLAACAWGSAAELGMKAPALEISDWIKGGPVDVTAGDGKSVFLVEFWATWCGPCRKSIPHLTQLQKKYKDKHLTVVSISTEPATRVKPFVDRQGDAMDYVVAVDNRRATYRAYMDAFGQRGIPHAFLIDQKGRIIWRGHPLSNIESVIEKLVNEGFTVEDAGAQKRADKATALLHEKIQQYLRLAVDPEADAVEAAKAGREIVEGGKDNASLMNDFAWMLMNEKRLAHKDMALALKAARYSYDATKGETASNVETYALALFKTGEKKRALELQSKAVELAKTQDVDKRILEMMNLRLKEFQEAVE